MPTHTSSISVQILFFSLLAWGGNTSVLAHSFYLGYSQSEQTSYIGERALNFSPVGVSGLISFDLGKDWSITLDHASLNDSQSIARTVDGALDIESWGAGLNYYWDKWALSVAYSDWQDELHIRTENDIVRFEQSTESPASSVSLSYNWGGADWQIELATGLHYSNWSQALLSQARLDQPEQTALDEGDSTFISTSVSATKLVPINAQNQLVFGGSFSWNYLTDNESIAVSRNGRNISQISQRLSAATVTGTESYGQLNLYISYDISESLLIDIDSTFDVGAQESTQAWSFNVGYLF